MAIDEQDVPNGSLACPARHSVADLSDVTRGYAIGVHVRCDLAWRQLPALLRGAGANPRYQRRSAGFTKDDVPPWFLCVEDVSWEQAQRQQQVTADHRHQTKITSDAPLARLAAARYHRLAHTGDHAPDASEAIVQRPAR